MFIDTHSHLYLEAFTSDLDQVIENALSVKVDKIILPNINVESIEGMLRISEQYPSHCFASMGLHPCDVKEDFQSCLQKMEKMASDKAYIAIGETGTDAYWDLSFWDQQITAFRIQLDWARELGKPIIIHSRESLDQNIEFVREAQMAISQEYFIVLAAQLSRRKRSSTWDYTWE